MACSGWAYQKSKSPEPQSSSGDLDSQLGASRMKGPVQALVADGPAANSRRRSAPLSACGGRRALLMQTMRISCVGLPEALAV